MHETVAISTVPPAKNGTVILIGRVGYACAKAALAVTEPSPIAVSAAMSQGNVEIIEMADSRLGG